MEKKTTGRKRTTGRIEHVILGSELKRLREKAGMSQVQLEAKIGRSRSFVARAEKGERIVDLPTLMDILRATGNMPLSEFMKQVEVRLDEYYRG